MASKKKYPGYLLAANPQNPRDDQLSQSLILVISHTDRVAVGLQINNPVEDMDLQTVARNIGMEFASNAPLYYGGLHAVNKIHVIHSNDWQGLSTVKINDELSVSNDISVLAAIAEGCGPERYRACAGFWHWDDRRLDNQLDPRWRVEPHKWELIPATADLIFDGEGPDQWQAALEASAQWQSSRVWI